MQVVVIVIYVFLGQLLCGELLGALVFDHNTLVMQVVLLVAMYMSISASALGIAEKQGIKISMYLRILIPIVFSRYVIHIPGLN